MSLYKRGDVWWYKFRFAGQMIRESSKSESKNVAKDAERIRRARIRGELESNQAPEVSASVFRRSTDWLKTRTSIAPSTERSYKLAISQLITHFGKKFLCDLSART